MSDFEQELRAGFLEEATQLLTEAEQCFLVLEERPDDKPTIEKIFRIAHNLKGSSKAVGFDALGAFTHEFESFLLKCKNGEIPIKAKTITLLLKCNDHVNTFIESLKADPSYTADSTALIAEIHAFKITDEDSGGESDPTPEGDSGGVHAAVEAEERASAEVSPDTEETFVDEVALLKKAQALFEEEEAQPIADLAPAQVAIAPTPSPEPTPELEATAPAPSPETTPAPKPTLTLVPPLPSAPIATKPTPPPANGTAPKPASDESIRVSLNRVEKLVNFVGELVILQTVLREQAYGENPALLRKTIHQMGKVTKEVQDLSMGLRMVPIKQTFQKMQRIVRDTSNALGKNVSMILEGEDTEVDKTVLEALGDPLVHLIRNACDHGIEAPADRKAKGKSETGTIILRAFHQSGKLIIEIKDDGGGIPTDRLREKALEKGILKPGQVISETEAINLIFHAGFSTKAQVTEVSGRGVGMDVVKTNIEQLQGEIHVDTRLNAGSTFKIILPLTLAIIDGMVVKCANERFIIPLSHVHESVRPTAADVHKTAGLGEVMTLRGETLPVLRLSHALGHKKTTKTDTQKETHPEQIAIIVRSQGAPFAAMVDDILGQYQVVIKKLGREMEHISAYSGSAILGDGRPALILELGDLLAKPKSRQVN